MNESPLQAQRRALQEQWGAWTTDVLLPGGITMRETPAKPEPRLRRIVQVIADLSKRPWPELRILDLGSLEGLFPIEFALRGASVVAVEGREGNVRKARFAIEAHGLRNIEVVQDDVRNVTLGGLGSFDAIVCSGVLYHLDAASACRLLESLFEMCGGMLIVDTHISLRPEVAYSHKGKTYWGRPFAEHRLGASRAEKEGKVWASLDNPESYWFTRQSLLELLQDIGFSSVYLCKNPVINQFADRETFVALRGARQELKATNPTSLLEPHLPKEARFVPSLPRRAVRALPGPLRAAVSRLYRAVGGGRGG